MSERDPRYNPRVLLSDALPNDCDSEEERSALSVVQTAFQHQLGAKQEIASLVQFAETKQFVKMDPSIQSHIKKRIEKLKNDVAFHETQIVEILESDVLESVVWKRYRQVCDEDLRASMKEENERRLREQQEIAQRWQESRRIAEENRAKAQQTLVQNTPSAKKETTCTMDYKGHPALICIGIIAAFWALILFGPALVMLFNRIAYWFSGGGFGEKSFGYQILLFLSQPIACGLAHSVAHGISKDEHIICVLVNQIIVICIFVLLIVFTFLMGNIVNSINHIMSAVVSIICAVITTKRLTQPQ